MGSFAKNLILCHTNMTNHHHHHHRSHPAVRSSPSSTATGEEKLVTSTRRWAAISTVLAASAAVLGGDRTAMAQSWGTHSFLKEKYFMPGLSPEEAVARIQQTAEGMRDLRHMLDTMSWRYVLYYVRLKSAYLDADLKTAFATLPENRRGSYVAAANDLVDNMSDLDIHVRSPKVYESYLSYERTLKSLDNVVALLK